MLWIYVVVLHTLYLKKNGNIFRIKKSRLDHSVNVLGTLGKNYSTNMQRPLTKKLCHLPNFLKVKITIQSKINKTIIDGF